MVKLTLCEYKHSIFEEGFNELDFDEQHALIEKTCGFFDNIIDAYEYAKGERCHPERLVWLDDKSVFVEICRSTAWFVIELLPYKSKKLMKRKKTY